MLLIIFQSNAYFQAAVHQAKSWKTQSGANKKEFEKAGVKIEGLDK